MDNVGCYGTEDRLIDCAYHTDTSEDSHSGDVWIECDTASSDPDGTNRTNNTYTGEKTDNGEKADTGEKTATTAEAGTNSDTGVIVAVVALVGLIILAIAFVGYIIYTRQSGIRERMK